MSSNEAFHKVPFDPKDIEQFNIKFPRNLFTSKYLWFAIAAAFAFIFILLFIIGITVSFISGDFLFRKDVLNRFISLLLLMSVLTLLFVVFTVAWNIIDWKLGYKKEGLFKITAIINLGTAKLLVLNKWRIYWIDVHNEIFKSVSKSQILKIEKTATNRLLYDLKIEK